MEENVNEVLGTNGTNTERTNERTTVNASSEDIHSASNGLAIASNICKFFIWEGIVMAVVSAFAYMTNKGDVDSYNDYKRLDALRLCAIASACFTYGVAEPILCYISSKILCGIGVIARAAEQYLSVQGVANTKRKETMEASEPKRRSDIDLSTCPSYHLRQRFPYLRRIDIDLSACPIALYKSKTESFEVRVVKDEGYGVYECVTMDGTHTYHFRREVLEFENNE